MTDDQLNQTLARIANHIEALSQSMDRFESHLERVEDAQAEDRRRHDEVQARADARLTRLENITMMFLRTVRRERSDLREKISALADAQIKAEARQARLEEAMAEMAQAVTKTNRRLDTLESNGRSEKEQS
jgi:chromosome segregation ATPase